VKKTDSFYKFVEKHLTKIVFISNAILAAWGLAGIIVESYQENTSKTKIVAFLLLVLFSIVFLLTFYILKNIKYRTLALIDIKEITDFFHSRLIHIVRNDFGNRINRSKMTENTKTSIQMLLDDLSDLLMRFEGKNGRRICVSLKITLNKEDEVKQNVANKDIIPEGNANSQTFKNNLQIPRFAKTVARSSNTPEKRKRYDSEIVSISKNTDFKKIVDGANYFASGNLSKLKKK